MKFFSNDAKENPDDAREHSDSDVVTSEPVPVPQQRAGSPWNDTPGSSDSELADREERDGTESQWGNRPDSTTDTETTTYGPDGTVTSTGPSDEPRSATETDTEVKDESIKDEGDFESPEAVDPATGESLDKTDEPSEVELSDKSDLATEEERDAEDRHDADPDADVASETDRESDRDADREAELSSESNAETRDSSDHRDSDADTFAPLDEPEPVDPTTGETLDKTADEPVQTLPAAVVDEPVPADTLADSETVDGVDTPVVAAVPVPVEAGAATADNAATPGSVAEPTVDRLFPAGDSFLERFREIQLGFVDTPKESAAQAADLVAEAVQSISAALTERKDALAAESDDTENLRVQLRGYRDLLNRITGL